MMTYFYAYMDTYHFLSSCSIHFLPIYQWLNMSFYQKEIKLSCSEMFFLSSYQIMFHLYSCPYKQIFILPLWWLIESRIPREYILNCGLFKLCCLWAYLQDWGVLTWGKAHSVPVAPNLPGDPGLWIKLAEP